MKKVYQHFHGNFQYVNAPRKTSRRNVNIQVLPLNFHGDTVCIIVDNVDTYFATHILVKKSMCQDYQMELQSEYVILAMIYILRGRNIMFGDIQCYWNTKRIYQIVKKH